MAFWQDTRHAFRLFAKNPGFTAVAVVSIGLGIGANTAIFTLMDAIMMKSLPVKAPQELMLLGEAREVGIMGGVPDGRAPVDLYSYRFYDTLASRRDLYSGVLAMISMPDEVHPKLENQSASSVDPANASLVSGNYFEVLGINAIRGRVLWRYDDKPNAAGAAVISYGYWKRRFALNPSAINSTVTIASTPFTIVGVTPPEFFGTTVGRATDIWIPLTKQAQVAPGWPPLDNNQMQSLYLIGRLKPGVTPSQAQAETDTLYHQQWLDVLGSKPTKRDLDSLSHAHVTLTSAERGLSQLRSQFSMALHILMVVVGAVLLIACANVANIVLARVVSRRREMAVRMAIGGTRRNLMTQMFAESLALSALGAVVGVLVAAWGTSFLVKLVATRGEISLNTAPDTRILAFTIAATLLTALLTAMAPMIRLVRMDLNEHLKEGKGTVGSHSGSTRRLLVAFQVALSIVLVTGSVLFIRTLNNLHNVALGFNREYVFQFELNPQAAGMKADASLVAVYHNIEREVTKVPGVAAAGFSMFSFHQGRWIGPAWPDGVPRDPQNAKIASYNLVTNNYFDAAGIPVIGGRRFNERDVKGAPRVVILNQAAATAFFGNESSVVGKSLRIPDVEEKQALEVVGVVKDAKYDDVREKAAIMVYFPFEQEIQFAGDLLVRLTGDRAAILPAVRHAIMSAAPELPISAVYSMVDIVDHSLARERMVTVISSVFGLLALTLACIGLYGVLSYDVQQRTNEIGIRMALGAERRGVIRMILGDAGMVVGLGILVGLAASFGLNHLLDKMLFGVSPADPIAMASAVVILALTSVIASVIPAARASRVDPLLALRYE